MALREVVAGLGNLELRKHHIPRHQLVERAVVRPPIFVAIQIAKKIWKIIVGIFGSIRIDKRRGLASIVGGLCMCSYNKNLPYMLSHAVILVHLLVAPFTERATCSTSSPCRSMSSELYTVHGNQ